MSYVAVLFAALRLLRESYYAEKVISRKGAKPPRHAKPNEDLRFALPRFEIQTAADWTACGTLAQIGLQDRFAEWQHGARWSGRLWRAYVRTKSDMLPPIPSFANAIESSINSARGGMGAVYQAMDENLNCVVAVKETFAKTEEHRRAFRREAELLANLNHTFSNNGDGDYFPR